MAKLVDSTLRKFELRRQLKIVALAAFVVMGLPLLGIVLMVTLTADSELVRQRVKRAYFKTKTMKANLPDEFSASGALIQLRYMEGFRAAISLGPDGVPDIPSDARLQQLPLYAYDPTNGLVSSGDIFYVEQSRAKAR